MPSAFNASGSCHGPVRPLCRHAPRIIHPQCKSNSPDSDNMSLQKMPVKTRKTGHKNTGKRLSATVKRHSGCSKNMIFARKHAFFHSDMPPFTLQKITFRIVRGRLLHRKR